MENVNFSNEEKGDLNNGSSMVEKDTQTEYANVSFVEVNLKEKESQMQTESDTFGSTAFSRGELLVHSSTSGWRIARWTLLMVFVLGWLGMVATAIYILATTPPCIPWWKSSIIYQIYPQSFSDSDGDGMGDIQGIINNLDYFEYLNVKAIWVNSVYKGPMVDLANDVFDYRDIDPRFGSLNQFEELIQSVHAKGMKIIMDFIPNHSSDQHEWFQESVANTDSEYKNYYIWEDGILAPNNWKSVYGGSAWTYNDVRKQSYLHQFLEEEPDLNYRDPSLRKKIEETMEYWLEKGIDGFRIDSAGYLLETENYEQKEANAEPDNAFDCNVHDEEYSLLNHSYTKDYNGLHDIIKSWRNGPFDYYSTTKAYRFMVTDNCADVDTNLDYYGTSSDPEADFPFNYNLLGIKSGVSGSNIQNLIKNEWLDKLRNDQQSNFLLGNDDHSRIGTRMGREYSRAAIILLLTLPGTPFTYYGEEIGMVDGQEPDSSRDPYGKDNTTRSRDPYRSPMQWSSDENAGFTTNVSSWLPVNDDYFTTNVKSQKSNTTSMLNLYREVALLREERTFLVGDIEFLAVPEMSLISYIRTLSGYKSYLVVINFGTTDFGTIDLWTSNSNLEDLTNEGTILVSSYMNRNDDAISLEFLSLTAYEALVIEMV